MNEKMSLSDLTKMIQELSEHINYLLNQINSKYVVRKRKTDIPILFAYRLLYSQIHKTQEAIVGELIHLLKDSFTVKSISDRDDQISVTVYKKLYDNITSYISSKTNEFDIFDEDEILSVDGTFNHIISKFSTESNA